LLQDGLSSGQHPAGFYADRALWNNHRDSLESEVNMKLPLQISFHGIDRSEALEQLISKEVEGLHKFDSELISCRVAVESEGRHQNQGRECSVRVNLTAPGKEFVQTEKNEDAHAAVRAAFDSLVRQVKDNASKRRGEIKSHQ
jgi:ribosomal subunit interface protein